MKLQSWVVRSPGQPMVLEERSEDPGPDEVIVQVAGCGVCHTDLGFFYGGVSTRHALPLTLGHEISGTIVATGEQVRFWEGRDVIVPAVLPCGSCTACRAGRGSICPEQIFPGNDIHGGFATHVRVPARGLCRVPDLSDATENPSGLSLSTLCVVADAVSTPFQAIARSRLEPGDLAVFVGAGGVGGFGVQLASSMGAHVIAIDTNTERLRALRELKTATTLDAAGLSFESLKKEVKKVAREREIPTWRWKIFETSGTPAGQTTAFGLVGHGGYLSIVGFTPEKITVRLSNLMAFDATCEGNWGCLPEHYPAVLDAVLAGKVKLEPFVEYRPLSEINETFEDLRAHTTTRRVILEPESTRWSSRTTT